MKLCVYVSDESHKSKMLEALLDFPEFDELNPEFISVNTPAQAEEALLNGVKVIPSLLKELDDGAISILSGLPSQNILIEWLGLEPAPSLTKD